MSKVLTPTGEPATATPEVDWSKLGDEQGQEILDKFVAEEDDEDGDGESPSESALPASDQTPKVGDKVAPADAPSSEEPVVDESALTAIEQADVEAAKHQPKPPEPPPLTSEQQLILSAIPNTAVAQKVIADATAFQGLDQAITSGNFEVLEKSFAPQAWAAFMDHIYSKAGEEFVQRYVDEREGKQSKPDPEVERLKREWSDFKTRSAQAQSEAQMRQQHERAQLTQKQRKDALNTHINQLVSTVKTEDASAKKFVKGLMMEFLSDEDSADTKAARQQILQGKYGLLTKHFRDSIVPEYRKLVASQKARDAQTDQKRTQQQQQRPVATPAAASGGRDVATPATEERVEPGSEAHWRQVARKIGLARLTGA